MRDGAELEALEQVAGPVLPVVHPPQPGGELEVLPRGGPRHQAADVGAVAGAPLDLGRVRAHVVAGDEHRAVGRRDDAGQHPHRRGLAGAVAPEQGGGLAGRTPRGRRRDRLDGAERARAGRVTSTAGVLEVVHSRQSANVRPSAGALPGQPRAGSAVRACPAVRVWPAHRSRCVLSGPSQADSALRRAAWRCCCPARATRCQDCGCPMLTIQVIPAVRPARRRHGIDLERARRPAASQLATPTVAVVTAGGREGLSPRSWWPTWSPGPPCRTLTAWPPGLSTCRRRCTCIDPGQLRRRHRQFALVAVGVDRRAAAEADGSARLRPRALPRACYNAAGDPEGSSGSSARVGVGVKKAWSPTVGGHRVPPAGRNAQSTPRSGREALALRREVARGTPSAGTARRTPSASSSARATNAARPIGRVPRRPACVAGHELRGAAGDRREADAHDRADVGRGGRGR